MRPIVHADGVINLPKLKTHMFMTLSGAVKNLFGVIPGLNKASYHARLADPRRFSEMLLDVAYFVKPRLNIVDAVLGMEGDGPGTGGLPREFNALIAGADPVTVDVACCRITGIDTGIVPVLAVAKERGLWSGRANDAQTLGVPIDELYVKDFVMPGSYEGIGVGQWGVFEDAIRRILRRFNRWPVPKAGRCTQCAACERACPVEAISIDQEAKVAKVDDALCIRCYCCHEVCPEAAIDLEHSRMGKVMHKLRLL
jgi:ferredoxin